MFNYVEIALSAFALARISEAREHARGLSHIPRAA